MRCWSVKPPKAKRDSSSHTTIGGDVVSRRVLVGMSGGVDSSVAVSLLLEQGYTVEGVTLRLCAEFAQSGAASLQAAADALAVAERLGIPHRVWDYGDLFRNTVIANFARVYAAGATPNPCIVCNRRVKFGQMLEDALAAGFDAIATGHYVRSEWDDTSGRWLLKKAADASRDQSYVLYMLTQHQLAHTVFPLGDYCKPQLRAMAQERGLVTADRPDSQDICFVPDGDYLSFLTDTMGMRFAGGSFVDENGGVLGTHRGIAAYTIGQRKGLGLALGEPRFVVAKDATSNTVTVGRSESLFSKHLIAENANWVSIESLQEPMRVTARTRYHQTEAPATVEPYGENGFRVLFDEPQRALTAGQAVVLYQDDIVVGGGTIC